MPVILKMENEDGQRSAAWEVREDEDTLLNSVTLNKADLHALSAITNPGRRLEWLAVRVLLKEFYPTSPAIGYHNNGKPYLVNQPDKISISHSGKMIAIALHPTRNPGIDIEIINARIFKIASRFLNKHENAFLGLKPTVEQLLIVWGAKEVMFKVLEHGGVSFKENFEVKPFTFFATGKLEGLIQTCGNNISVPMEYRRIEDYMLVQTDY
jgi:4'-phosphopantetheinyl transferase